MCGSRYSAGLRASRSRRDSSASGRERDAASACMRAIAIATGPDCREANPLSTLSGYFVPESRPRFFERRDVALSRPFDREFPLDRFPAGTPYFFTQFQIGR